MQSPKSHMRSFHHGKLDSYLLHIGVFAAVCVVVDLAFSHLSQLISCAKMLNTIILVALSAGAFYVGSMTGRPQYTAAGNGEASSVEKIVRSKSITHEGECNTRQSAKRSGSGSGTTPMRAEVLDAMFAALDDIDAAQPEVGRQVSQEAQTTQPQSDSLQKPLNTPRSVSRSSAGTQVPTASEDATDMSVGAEEAGQSEVDAHVIDQATPSVYPDLLLRCIQRNDVDMALEFFNQILGADLDYEDKWTHFSTMPPDARTRFFTLVAGQLDDERLREDGLNILMTVRTHGVQPPVILQDRLICAWGSKLPDNVRECLKDMQEEGLTLSSSACQCLMAGVAGSGGLPLRGRHDSGEQKNGFSGGGHDQAERPDLRCRREDVSNWRARYAAHCPRACDSASSGSDVRPEKLWSCTLDAVQ